MFTLIIAIVIVALTLFKLLKPKTFWTQKGVPVKDALPILGHSAAQVFRTKPKIYFIKDLYDQFPDKRYFGIYTFGVPILLIRDPELLKQIAIKDFDHFTDHRTIVPPELDYLWGRNLFNLKGAEWKTVRSTLTPAYTTSKMKTMFHLMCECSETFTNYFLANPNEAINIDAKDILSRYTNDIIGTVGFGIKCDSLNDRNNEFYMMGKKATDFSGFWKIISFTIAFTAPSLATKLGIRVFSKKVANYFTKVISETIKFREEKNVRRPDLLQQLIETRKPDKEDVELSSKEAGFAATEEEFLKTTTKHYLTDGDITAQALILFLGGFETVSQPLAFLCYELAINSDIQKRLRNEIEETLKNCKDGKVTYEAITKMKYLDMVISEILRKYPPFVTVDRMCVKPYVIEPKLSSEKPVLIDQNQMIWYSPYALHHDENYFPNPDKFDPERFNDENKTTIKPYTYVPFGLGPRNCIGSRFALLESKILIFHLLQKFDLLATKETIVPMQYKTGVVNIAPAKPIILTMKARC